MRKHVKGNVSSSQNAYLIEEEKTVLIDTVWTPHRFDFVENLKKEVDFHKIVFIVVNHGDLHDWRQHPVLQ